MHLLISDKDQILPNSRSSQMRLVVLVTGASGQLVKPYIILQRNMLKSILFFAIQKR
jgi:hypothetical protein